MGDKMLPRALLFLGAISVLSMPVSGFAQGETDQAPDETGGALDAASSEAPTEESAADASQSDDALAYPVRFARRPLVVHEGMVRGDARLTVGGVVGSGTFSSLDLGGAVSPVENLEIGASARRTGAIPAPGGNGLISVIFSPDASYGDIPVYGRYQFHRGDVFLAGVDLVLVLPTNTDFTLTAGLPMRVLEIFGLITADFNIDVRYRAGDKFVAAGGSNATFDFTFSGASAVSITDQGFIEIGGGVGVVNVNGASGSDNVVELPFFLGGGYTYEGKNHLLVDLFVQFGWQPLMTVNGPPGRSTFNVGDDWFTVVGATIYTKPLFGE